MAENIVRTKNKFGVPFESDSGSGILMPKLKFRFRVTFTDNFGESGRGLELTQNVVNVTRPKVAYEEVVIDSYNSRVYVAGKHAWEPITVVLRDDIRGTVTKQVGAQNMKQLNHFEQKSPIAGSDYKFDMTMSILDGQTANPTEYWSLEGCFITQTDYSDTDYATNEPVQITMTLRYDNAIHVAGDSTAVQDLEGGLFPAQDLSNTTEKA
jgi:hypothetical protein